MIKQEENHKKICDGKVLSIRKHGSIHRKGTTRND